VRERMSGLTALSLLLTVASCQARPDLDAARQSLLEADRKFARSVAEHRLEAWVEAFDTTGIQMRPNTPFTPGHDEIRRQMTPAFADTTWHLSWEPSLAFVSASADLGYTLGTYRSVRRDSAGEERSGTGKYVTIWRKQADGAWKVVFDGGNPDSSP
jgi:ketosteroid isomerase-like protein